MLTSIEKRDGHIEDFDSKKIYNAVKKALVSIGCGDLRIAEVVEKEVVSQLEECLTKCPTVEEVQDLVEKVLINKGFCDVAKEYILYRYQRSKYREMKSDIMEIYKGLTFRDSKDNDLKRENANINADSAMGTMLKYGSEGAKNFYKKCVMDPRFSFAHDNGDIHIHDMDFYILTETCCYIDLGSLLKKGFSTGHGYIREPNSIQTASALACIAIQANQNDQHGGQCIPCFDYGLAPYVAKSYIKELKRVLFILGYSGTDWLDIELNSVYEIEGTLFSQISQTRVEEALITVAPGCNASKIMSKAKELTKEDTHQAMEALIHNLNSMHSRAGAQIPFSSINYGTDVTEEGRMVVDQVLEATWEGLGNGETPIFPIQIFKVKEGVNYNVGEPNYDLFKKSCKVSAKRLFPNFSFLDSSFNLEYYKKGRPETEAAYMGCRTRVMSNIYDPSKQITFGRGNLSFTSINLPRLAIEAKSKDNSIEYFMKSLEDMIYLVIDQLLERFKIQCSKHVYNYPFLMEQGVWLDSEKLDITDSVEEVLKHGTLTCGFIGLAECLKSLCGSHHGESQEAQKLGLSIVSFMRDKMDEASKEYNLNFSLIATPAEGLSGRFVRIDKERYGVIEGVTNRDYYTNSFHVPVYYPITIYRKLEIEAPYHNLTNGGHVSYVELDGDPLKNLSAFEDIIRAMKELGIGYGSVNHNVDRCPVCGYTGIIDDVCPLCGRHDGEAVSAEKLKSLGFKVKEVD